MAHSTVSASPVVVRLNKRRQEAEALPQRKVQESTLRSARSSTSKDHADRRPLQRWGVRTQDLYCTRRLERTRLQSQDIGGSSTRKLRRIHNPHRRLACWERRALLEYVLLDTSTFLSTPTMWKSEPTIYKRDGSMLVRPSRSGAGFYFGTQPLTAHFLRLISYRIRMLITRFVLSRRATNAKGVSLNYAA